MTDRYRDHQAIRPDLGHGDLDRRQRHHQKMVHGSVLALAHNCRTSKNDREHGDVVDDGHHARKPGGCQVWIERNAHIEIHWRRPHTLRMGEEILNAAHASGRVMPPLFRLQKCLRQQIERRKFSLGAGADPAVAA